MESTRGNHLILGRSVSLDLFVLPKQASYDREHQKQWHARCVSNALVFG